MYYLLLIIIEKSHYPEETSFSAFTCLVQKVILILNYYMWKLEILTDKKIYKEVSTDN